MYANETFMNIDTLYFFDENLHWEWKAVKSMCIYKYLKMLYILSRNVDIITLCNLV